MKGVSWKLFALYLRDHSFSPFFFNKPFIFAMMYSVTLHRINVSNLSDSKPQMLPKINQGIKLENTAEAGGSHINHKIRVPEKYSESVTFSVPDNRFLTASFVLYATSL